MTTTRHMPGLRIESPLVAPNARNFRPPCWPPPPDFPVVIDAEGVTVSTYSDPTWTLTPWAEKALSINFGDDQSRGGRVSTSNADVLRMATAWDLWGPKAVSAPGSLLAVVRSLKPAAEVCSRNGIDLRDLWRFPHVIDEVAARTPKSKGTQLIGLLLRLLASRDELGFVVLDENGIKRLAEKLPKYETVQTAYVPPRIWTYQVLRLREFLDDYLAHKDKIEACFSFCVDAYRANAGGWKMLFKQRLAYERTPFCRRVRAGSVIENRRYYGPFEDTARRFGIHELLIKWIGSASIKDLSSLLTMVREVGVAYCINFTLMRIDEAVQLRAGCYSVEIDPVNQDVHMLACTTSKTQYDPDARWICSPSVSVAIEAMTHVAKLRLQVSRHSPRRRLRALDLSHPVFFGPIDDPWAGANEKKGTRSQGKSYKTTIKDRPLLFDKAQLRITQADLDIAQTMTFGLDPKKFAVGKVWPFAWHQLRRTGVCNMLASGLVSESSLRYQLKHLTIVMTRYYGQNYFRLNANLTDEATGFFVREMYQAIARGFRELSGDEYFSPHGQKRKDQILQPVTESDHMKLINAAKSGAITYRETLLGGCTQVTCLFGGISNIANCMGKAGDSKKPCDNLIINKDRRNCLVDVMADFEVQLRLAPPGSPMWHSLMANHEAAKEAINVIDQN